MKPGDLVTCVRGHCGADLVEGQQYRIAVIVRDWIDHRGAHEGGVAGFILFGDSKHSYPYVWDSDRFIPHKVQSNA